MARVIRLDIKNYRGIKELLLEFKIDQNLICLIGRGDSGKTTVLDAISSVLSPSWNLSFYDTDFYKCDHESNIEIIATLIDIPEKLLSDNKFGLYIRSFDKDKNEIIDNIESNSNLPSVLTIKLTVDGSLEPIWVVTNSRDQEDKKISGADRAQLNCYMISDYVDRHFSWNKGNPLYALLKSINSEDDTDDNIVIQCLRKAKDAIDGNSFKNLEEVTKSIKLQAAELGLDISKASTTLDSRELSIKDSRISLHENSVPFRQKGKGSKRLASIAIQSELVRQNGIMLIDEIEQGLEPDRIKQLVRALKNNNSGQIFITTHSRDAITELGSEPLVFLLKDKKTDDIEKRDFDLSSDDLQKTIRACPEAFFAKKVIVCEGATEVGICRALDKWRRNSGKSQISFKDCAYVDGTGNTFVQRVKEINDVGLKTVILCDSDDATINNKKSQWETEGVSIFDCEDNLCLEQQVFKDLPWDGIKKLLEYVLVHHKKNDRQSLENSIKAKYPTAQEFPSNWENMDTVELRQAMAAASLVKDKNWFKALHHGEVMGDIIFKHIDELGDDAKLKKNLIGLSNWIDGENS